MAEFIATLLGVVLLVVVPGVAQPFTTPKLLVGTAGPAIILLWAIATGRLRWRVPANLAIALMAFAVAMGIAAARAGAQSFPQCAFLLSGPVIFVLILALDEPAALRPARGLVWAAVAVAAIAVAQRAGFDPWRFAGWAPSEVYGSPRMRAYATLGNPNFVASVLGAALPWTLAVVRGAWMRAFVSLVLIAGILATGSRVGIIAAGVGLACLVRLKADPTPVVGAGSLPVGAGFSQPLKSALAVVVAVVLAVAVSERAVGESIAGRLVPVRVAWPHALEQPFIGHGLGAVARDYAAWQAAFFADPSRASLAGFAGDFDHLHHEPLEWLIETGLVGMAAWVAVVALALRAGRGRAREAGAPATRAAALSALAAVAVLCLADFPLHRPADYLAAWLALAMAARPKPRAEQESPGRI
jgi:hypothetical protein